MSEYRHNLLLQPGSIRLLRLLPSKGDLKNIRCELFEYDLEKSDQVTRPYEALSYVWGSEDTPQTIIIGDQRFKVTQNLHTALLRLQDHSIPRILWVDAICINQTNEKEKGHQLQFMAEIYAKASRVIVWLGKAQDNSEHALEVIRLAGQKSTNLSNTEPFQQEILQLLQRQWFRRIWVLQEVAAARHVLIMCGPTEIDGHAFCLGLELLNTALEDSMYQVTFLIREAIFRPRHLLRKHGRLSLDICSLGELVDMYHAYEATKCHDKVYALLGMSSDDIRVAGLKPNYNNRWSTLLWSLIRFLLNNQASVKTWDDRQMAVIKSKGCILGKVSAVETIIDLGGRQRVEAIFKNLSNQLGCIRDGSARWTLQNSAKSIQNGDFICLLQGASKPTIIRLCKDHFTIIMIAAVPPKSIRTGDGDIDWPRLSQSVPFTRDFLLIWDWEVSSENSQDLGKYDTFIQTTNDRLGYLEALLEGQLDNATRTWNIALIMGDLGEYEKAEERLREGIEGYEIVFGEEHPHTIESQYGLTPLSWAAGNGYSAIVKLLLMKNDVDADLKDSQYGRTPLSWAARSGHEAVVKQLLTTGKAVDVDSKDGGGQTPLSWAAQNGHEAVVKLLLATGKVVDVDSKDEGGQTPLSWAAQNGHEAVVKLLLATGKATIDSEDGGGQTPLWWAAQNGHEAVVKLLLATGKVDVNSKDKWHSRTPMLWAAQNGHEAVVKLFLTTSKATIDSKDRDGQTPLSWAAKNGHGAIVKLLLTTDADVDSNDGGNQTPLSWAAQNGHEAVVRLLLATGKATVDSNDRGCQTPLWWAARYGHEAVVKLLLLTEADVDSKNWDGRTPLSWAAQNGHEAVVKLLLATEADVDSRDGGDQTPLWWAAQNGHEAVVKLLLATGKVDVNSKDKWYGRTPLSWASQNGHKAVVKLLQLASSS